MISNEHVQVLLAVKNGGEFLVEQLESLKNQIEVKIHLIVGIADSIDDSRRIIEGFSDAFTEFQIVQTSFGSSTKDFLHLLSIANPNLPTAFCDQDDLWFPSKLKFSLLALGEFTAPAAVCVGWRGVNASGKLSGKEFNPKREIKSETLLFQNQFIGSSIIMNEQALAECQNCLKVGGQEILAHDWWTLLLISMIGLVRGLDIPLMSYRIHTSNTVGIPKPLSHRWIANRSRASWVEGVKRQISGVKIYASTRSSKIQMDLLADSISFLNGQPRGTMRILLSPQRFRSNLFDEILLRVAGLIRLGFHLMKRTWIYVKGN